MKTAALILTLILSTPAVADELPDGEVTIPVSVYNQLVEATHSPVEIPASAPAEYAIGTATITANVSGTRPSLSARVTADLTIDVFENGWVGVPVLSVGTPVESVTVGGKATQLISTADGLVWGTRTQGSYAMKLVYRVDASTSDEGSALAVPVPPAAAINLIATLPGTDLDVAVIPSAAVQTSISGNNTRVSATVPTTRGVHISWRIPTGLGHSIGRATYSGRLENNAVTWAGHFLVEVFRDETVTLPLMPRTTTLREVSVNGKEAPILIEGEAFATLVHGRGRHEVVVGFQTPVKRGDGPPRIDLQVPPVPVSRFDLSLPGKKDVTVSPTENVSHRSSKDTTTATVFFPMVDRVSFSWAEAVPDAVKAEVRSNAAIYHAVIAEEGVLSVRAMLTQEVTRGETSIVKLEVPPGVQVNRISSPSGAVADWRISKASTSKPRELSIFLDRKLKGTMHFEINYDRSLGKAEQVAVPLIRSIDAQRQHGMVALLASRELTLKPVDDGGISRVGENQLPGFVRDGIEHTIAHTFKYVELPRKLTAEAVPPERQHGRFDVQVDSLISVGEVTMRGATSVEVNLKSGGIMELQLALPDGVNLLNLAGPSLRTYAIEPGAGEQLITVFFTQEMEGQFRLELTYERIMVDGEAAAEVPRVSVLGAEVEQGRIAIEALSTVEVQPTISEALQALDIAELPRQLLLRTTNPILHAYKYVHTEKPIRLALELTRHRVVDVKEAAIDSATYTTLFTSDGLAVTTAVFEMRNSRKQFLRLTLPEGSTVWSATVDGKPEKPALGEGDEEGNVLVKIVTSTSGFSVHLIYATEGPKVRGLGTVKSPLARPDILVTRTRWDVFLPADMNYSRPRSNMNLVTAGGRAPASELEATLAKMQSDRSAGQTIDPLFITVPTTGTHLAFEKLYANQGDEQAWFRVSYSSAAGARLGTAVSLLATLLVWASAWSRLGPHALLSRRQATWSMIVGVGTIVVAVGLYKVSLAPALWLTAFLIATIAGRHGWRWWSDRQETAAVEAPI